MSNRENIVTGQKYRILSDAANKIWDRISFWTKASDVEIDENTTLSSYVTQMTSQIGDYKLKPLSESDWEAITTKDENTIYFIYEEDETEA